MKFFVCFFVKVNSITEIARKPHMSAIRIYLQLRLLLLLELLSLLLLLLSMLLVLLLLLLLLLLLMCWSRKQTVILKISLYTRLNCLLMTPYMKGLMVLLKYAKNVYVRYACRGKVCSPRTASMLSMTEIGSQQHVKPTITAARVLVTFASSTFALSR